MHRLLGSCGRMTGPGHEAPREGERGRGLKGVLLRFWFVRGGRLVESLLFSTLRARSFQIAYPAGGSGAAPIAESRTVGTSAQRFARSGTDFPASGRVETTFATWWEAFSTVPPPYVDQRALPTDAMAGRQGEPRSRRRRSPSPPFPIAFRPRGNARLGVQEPVRLTPRHGVGTQAVLSWRYRSPFHSRRKERVGATR